MLRLKCIIIERMDSPSVTLEKFTADTGININILEEQGIASFLESLDYHFIKMFMEANEELDGYSFDEGCFKRFYVKPNTDIISEGIFSKHPIFDGQCLAMTTLALTGDYALFDACMAAPSWHAYAAVLAALNVSYSVFFKESYDGKSPAPALGAMAFEDLLSNLEKPKAGLGIQKIMVNMWNQSKDGRLFPHSVAVFIFSQADYPPSFVVYDPNAEDFQFFSDYATPNTGFSYSDYVQRCYEIATLAKIKPLLLKKDGIKANLSNVYKKIKERAGIFV